MLEPLGPQVSGRLLGDAYAVQHPGVPERRAIQSVCVHLILLCATLERDWPPDRAVQLRRRALARPPVAWRWLDPDLPLGTLTVASVAAADGVDDRARRLAPRGGGGWSSLEAH